MINTAFFGTSDRSVPILNSLKDDPEINLCLVVTKKDVLVGRKQELKENEVKTWSKQNDIQYFETDSLKNDKMSVVEHLSNSKVDLGVVADFSFIIPEEIIRTPKHGLINIHFSLLPKYRGASPVQHAILNGDESTGITYHLVHNELDRGDIIDQIEYKIPNKITSGELYDKMFPVAAKFLPVIIKEYINGNVNLQEQEESEASYTYSSSHPKSTFIYKEDAKIDWSKSPKEIERAVRAFLPWPVAWTTLGEMTKALNLKLKEGRNPDLKVKIFEAEIKDRISVIKLQVEGKNVSFWKDFENGFLQVKK